MQWYVHLAAAWTCPDGKHMRWSNTGFNLACKTHQNVNSTFIFILSLPIELSVCSKNNLVSPLLDPGLAGYWRYNLWSQVNSPSYFRGVVGNAGPVTHESLWPPSNFSVYNTSRTLRLVSVSWQSYLCHQSVLFFLHEFPTVYVSQIN